MTLQTASHYQEQEGLKAAGGKKNNKNDKEENKIKKMGSF